MLSRKVILLDNWFWHENFVKDYKVFSSGFFEIQYDPYDKDGFNVCCGGQSLSIKECSTKEDSRMIKDMLLGKS